MSYTTDYRKRTLEYRAEGHTLQETRNVFKVNIGTIRSWEKLKEEQGTPAKRALQRSFKKIDPEKLRAYIDNHPDAIPSEIAQEFHCSETAIRKAFKRLGITRKKRQSAIKSKIR